MFIRGYMRASTRDQDAERARKQLEDFAAGRGLTIAAWYVENESGAKLDRPELFRLLRDCQPGDVLLVEQVDRLSRLRADDWRALKAQIAERRVKVVALDLPTSHQFSASGGDEITERIFEAMNAMMLDVLAAVARKDYDDRRRRQAQGIDKAKAAGRYAGRPENVKRNAAIEKMLKQGQPWSAIQAASGCSRSTLSRLARRLKGEAAHPEIAPLSS